jgi:hypothetical protein
LAIDKKTDELLLPDINHTTPYAFGWGEMTHRNVWEPSGCIASMLAELQDDRFSRHATRGVESMQRKLATSHCVFFRIPIDESGLPGALGGQA